MSYRSDLSWCVQPGALGTRILAGVREQSARPSLPEIFTEHGVKAELHLLPIGPGVFGETLLAAARQLRADMLVMGAYAHGPPGRCFLAV
jgi:hypothetical protein